eukprot:Blabericola_migrator_1__3643@NODE_2091_length_3291_cov_110_778226_g1325_i0_p1_GENE_NODE_2091_length_3291_cov_110_778226_g1325_i0NODE_2091_length_3291_cov_110_778226_g1325_i0_p1_ORF_typecomplete_len416_score45_63zfRING_2/PF13639_6/8_8e15zfC3HC4_2/PF13923_6/1_3e08zfrbx1/PF12678_7/2e03zfrbx1/PF12678_7/8_4e07zfC3HC4_3/PF13920_6/88zfC3HC4_3/PF13920_6/3_2e08zfRING_5/PF14634_6/1_4e07zfANAPC11/PF12861_7/2e07zfC3HC4/PF00097_25/9_8e07zfRING_11/PF17123_5/6_9e03zfRING_11/PF17123_5/1_1e06ProkRING_4/PF14447_6
MSSADALGIVIEESRDDPTTQPQEPAEDAYTRTVLTSAFTLRCLDLLLNVSLLIAQQIQFSPTWGQSCDYPIKIWATVWISNATIRSIIMLINGLRVLNRRPIIKGFKMLQLLLEVLSLAWFLYGIDCIFAKKSTGRWCNVVSKRWALAGWIIQAVLILLPCAMVCVCVPFLLCLLRVPWIRERVLPLILTVGGPASTNQISTPEEIINKLKRTTFQHAVDAREIDFDPADGPVPTAATDDMARNLLGLPGYAISQVMARFNSQGGEGRSGGIPVSTHSLGRGGLASDHVGGGLTPSGVEHTAVGGYSVPPIKSSASVGQSRIEMSGTPGTIGELPHTGYSPLPTLTCPICVTEFAGSDEIILLPCDPRRHVFHTSCILEWLRKSQHCPMCRKNIVELLGDRTADEATREGASEP